MSFSEASLASRIFLFNGMEESETASYISMCDQLQYSSNEVIHSSLHPLRGIGLVLSGRAKIVSGSGDTLLRSLEIGDIFGAASVFSLKSSNRTAVVASGKCRILLISEEIITKIITEDPDAAKRYIAFLSDRISFLNSRISNLTAGDAIAKTAGFILSLEQDEEGRANVNDSFSNIASRLNMGRASLYRTIDRFVAEGLISRDKDVLTILDRDGLENIIFKKNPVISGKERLNYEKD